MVMWQKELELLPKLLLGVSVGHDCYEELYAKTDIKPPIYPDMSAPSDRRCVALRQALVTRSPVLLLCRSQTYC